MTWLARLKNALPRANTQAIGQAGEDHALQYLQAQGLRLLERNFRCQRGEIDLIMQEGQQLIFVEVRKRASRSHGGAAASVTPSKQRRLLLAAQYYLQTLPQIPRCRFDLIAIDGAQTIWLKDIIAAE